MLACSPDEEAALAAAEAELEAAAAAEAAYPASQAGRRCWVSQPAHARVLFHVQDGKLEASGVCGGREKHACIVLFAM